MEQYNRDKFLLDANTCRLVTEYAPDRKTTEELSELFFALCDGTRLRILSALAVSPMCVNDLSGLLSLNQTTVSHQLRTLRSCGAVEYRRQGKVSFYSVRNRKLMDVMLAAVECLG
jgi:DNA-binding transcriptional ArsR family regulator